MDTVQRQASYDIGGVRYPQPFKIRRLGHFGFNVPDLEAGIDFYARAAGLPHHRHPGLQQDPRPRGDGASACRIRASSS